MKSTQRTFEQLSDLQFTVSSREYDERVVPSIAETKLPLNVLWITFSGPYSERDDYDHEVFMVGAIKWAMLAWPSDGLVLDLRALSYEWGDRMQRVLNAGFSQFVGAKSTIERIFGIHRPAIFPVAVVVSESCRDAIRSLVRDEIMNYAGAVVDTEGEAIEHIHNQWMQNTTD